MGVRSYFPGSIAFVVTLVCGDRRLRVEVVLDLQERLLFVPIGILPDVSVHLDRFVEQLGAIAANILAFQKWDGKDQTTEYQPLYLLKGYQPIREQLRFNVVLGEPYLLSVGELDTRSEVWLKA